MNDIFAKALRGFPSIDQGEFISEVRNPKLLIYFLIFWNRNPYHETCGILIIKKEPMSFPELPQ